eukprot:CAMPEP_0182420708 /NCGR_PEP_ID=MMETSP1167-20130531/5708_1 /TAXON_ID=2988 /ORGANISM="Mallomonas Sp, Strain CCMP3275" /LENGTH=283 /DNA_ID=CAMNT_0024597029 /DNA_START=99 /DNA_END=950 /DNA_ORIENTATION=+
MANIPPKSKIVFKGLESWMFQHHLDRKTTKQLSSLLYVEQFIRILFQYVEDTFVVSNLASGILVGPQQMPQLYNDLLQSCEILDITPIPELYVRQNPIPNAYTLAVRGRKPFIVLHTSIIDLLSPEEVQAVLAHELGHLKCEHGLWVTALNVLVESVNSVGGDIGMFATLPLKTLLLRWQQSAEFSCDRAALLVVQDVNIVASVMMKLCGGSSSLASQLDVKSFINQAEKLEEATKSLSGRATSAVTRNLATHPIPVLRARELMQWQKSPQYRGLLRRAEANV